MSETNGFEPKIVAYVCNWCTYLGADLAGTSRMEYPPNVRIVRLPCTGRIDFQLLVKAFEIGADAVLVSGCHPGDCHYTAGNYHARRRWILFRELLDVLGFDLRRIHFTWISAAEGRKFQQVITDLTAEIRRLGPYRELYAGDGVPPPPAAASAPRAPETLSGQEELRAAARELLEAGTVKTVIGYGARGPVFVTRPEDVSRLVWNTGCDANLTAYLKRKEVRALGKAAIVVKGCDERGLVVLEQENQLDRAGLHVIGMTCGGMGQPRCERCEVRQPRFADRVIGPPQQPAAAGETESALDAFLRKTPAERMAWWATEFDRCTRCYACRQSCPMCYCETCVADKNRPVTIRTSATRTDNFAWHIARAFHLAGRCVACGACSRACPAGINLGLLNMALARAAQRHFDYRAGMDPAALPVIGRYQTGDREDFIR